MFESKEIKESPLVMGTVVEKNEFVLAVKENDSSLEVNVVPLYFESSFEKEKKELYRF